MSNVPAINAPFQAEGPAGGILCRADARDRARGWLWKHESGTYVKFTSAGAELFA
jgi:hypothetical protein